MISVTGMELISYCLPESETALAVLAASLGRAKYSSLAKLRIWERSRTFILLGDVASEPPKDRVER